MYKYFLCLAYRCSMSTFTNADSWTFSYCFLHKWTEQLSRYVCSHLS